jgi:hypothetical protein
MNSAARIARTTRNAAAAAKAIAERKTEAERLIARLQAHIAAVPADGSWGQAGNVGHAVELLTQLDQFFSGTTP